MEFDKAKYEADCKKRQAQSRRPKLTLKAAKAIAIQELGTAKGLVPHESNNAEYQRYEMQMGNHTVVIANVCGYWGIAYILFGDKWTYYDIDTLQESYYIADAERKQARREVVRDMVCSDTEFVFKTIVEEHGADACHSMLDEAARNVK